MLCLSPLLEKITGIAFMVFFDLVFLMSLIQLLLILMCC